MMRTILILVSVLIASVLVAAEPQQITVWKLDAGYYVVSGSQIVAFPPGGPVVPPVDPVVPPAVLSVDAKAIKTAAEAAVADPNRENTAKGLATAAGLIRKSTADGTLPNYEAISRGLAFLWDGTTKLTAWTPVRKIVFDRLEALAQEGSQPAAYVAYLADVEKGFTASIPVNLLMDDDTTTGHVKVAIGGQDVDLQGDWQQILMMLFEMFIKFILPYIIS